MGDERSYLRVVAWRAGVAGTGGSGDRYPRARTLTGQQGEAALALAALNQMIRAAKPVSVRCT